MTPMLRGLSKESHGYRQMSPIRATGWWSTRLQLIRSQIGSLYPRGRQPEQKLLSAIDDSSSAGKEGAKLAQVPRLLATEQEQQQQQLLQLQTRHQQQQQQQPQIEPQTQRIAAMACTTEHFWIGDPDDTPEVIFDEGFGHETAISYYPLRG